MFCFFFSEWEIVVCIDIVVIILFFVFVCIFCYFYVCIGGIIVVFVEVDDGLFVFFRYGCGFICG